MRLALSKYAIHNPEYLHIHDKDGSFAYGSDQEWYPTLWQRRAGCGPTTASNIVLYFLQKQNPRTMYREDALVVMQEMWKLVTPGIMGVHLTSQFTRGVDAYLPSLPMALAAKELKIPKAKGQRPSLASVADFLAASFTADCPVAFLNLSKGSLTNLYEWHWVTIVGMEQDREGGRVLATLYDDSQIWEIDLGLWLETTSRGGGFVSYQPSLQ